jgi:hypothetical protein
LGRLERRAKLPADVVIALSELRPAPQVWRRRCARTDSPSSKCGFATFACPHGRRAGRSLALGALCRSAGSPSARQPGESGRRVGFLRYPGCPRT